MKAVACWHRVVARVLLWGVVGGVLGGVLPVEARAQNVKGNKGRTAQAEPTILDRVQSHEWVFTTTVTVRIDQSKPDARGMPRDTDFKFDTASVLFPVPVETAASVTAPALPAEGAEPGKGGGGGGWRYATGTLSIDGRPADERPTFLTDYPSGTRLGKWIARDFAGQSVVLEVNVPVTCYQTRFDEAAAMKVGWPQSWPAVAQSCFQPQYWVDSDPHGAYDMKPVQDLVKRATAGKDPKSVPPAMLAKVLAGEVLEAIQPSDSGLAFARTGELEGIDLQGAPETIRRGKGSEFDIACVLAAVYRTAGLPARIVTGYDVGATKTDGKKFLGKRGSSDLRAWVEFPLVNPKDNKLVWIPVDVNRMRKSSSRMKPFDQRWPYFGEHDELDRVIPIAFQFHPPTTAVAHGSPAFWGWLVTPKPPERVMQTVRFRAMTAPRTAEDMQRIREEEQKDRSRGR